MREKLSRFMWGRYGNDQLNRFLMVVMLILLVLHMIFGGPFYLLALALLIYSYFRMFSRNIAKRSAENQWYLRKSMKFRGLFQKKRRELSQLKQYHIYRCPNCKQKIRVPRGRGKIAVTCRKCGTEFVKKS
ncbi:MAG: zinc-ribbon domain-containing protein [bacterium]|nr:zinc-ribbon domain-containing protein [bacterium]